MFLADGNQLGEMGSLRKALKKLSHPSAVLKSVGKSIQRFDPIGGRILAQAGRDISNVRNVEKRIDTAVTKSKIGQGVLYAAGAVAAPFTGGWSLALTAAAIQKAKANASGKSIAAQITQGAAAGAVGYAAGYGISAAYGALTTPAALPGVFAGETATVPGTFTAAQAASAAASDAATLAPAIATAPAVSAATSAAATAAGVSGTFLSTFGQTALVGLSLLKAVAGVKGGASESAPGAFDTPQYGAPVNYFTSGGGGGYQSGGDSGTSPTGESTDPTDRQGDMPMGLSRNTILVGGGILLAGVVAMSMRKQRRKV